MKKDLTWLITFMLILVSFFAAQEQFTGRATNNCIDSDGGLEYTIKGIVTVESEKLTDSCQETILTEYYCSQNSPRSKVYTCPNGCQDGACKSETKQQTTDFSTATNKIEIGEYLGEVLDTLTADNTPALASKRISTGKTSTLENQYLRFKGDDLLSGRILYTENDNNVAADYLVFEEQNNTFEYELDFQQGLESAKDSSTLTDLKNTELFMLGRTYLITDAENSGNQVKLRLMTGAKQETLKEGQQQIYKINGKDYVVKIAIIDDQARTVTFSVNGQMSGQRSVGDQEEINGLNVGILRVYVNKATEQQEDQVTLAIQAQTVEFTDTNTGDAAFTEGVSIDGRSLSNTYASIEGSGDSTSFEITSLRYRVQPNNELFIPAGKGLKEQLDNPEALLGDWDIKYLGLDVKNTVIRLNPHGDRYNLEFKNVQGENIDTTLVTNVGGNLKLGTDSQALHFIEGTSTTNFIITQNDEFMLTSQNDRTGVTNILKYDGIDTTNKKISFDDLAKGRKEISYTGTEGTDATADLVVSGEVYKIYIGPAPEYKLAVDLNHDGDVNSDEVNVVIMGGGILDLGSTITPNTDFNITLTTQARQFNSRSTDESIIISILKSGSNVDLDLPIQTDLSIESQEGEKLAMSNYGIAFKQKLDNPDKLTIQYPLQQAIGKVQIIFQPQEQGKMLETKQPEVKTREPVVTSKEIPTKETTQQQPIQEEPKPVVTYETKRAGFFAWLVHLWEVIKSLV